MQCSNGGEEELVATHAAAIVGQLESRLADITGAVQTTLAAEFAEIGGHGELLDLLHDAVEGNLVAYIPAIRHRIPTMHIRPPTSALEHARRMAQRGVAANILVRGYRLGHQALLDGLVREIHDAGLEAQLGLDVFQYLSKASFDYVDRIMEEILDSHQRERDRWLTNKNRLRAVRVQEALESADADFDEMSTAVGYPFDHSHLACVIWREGPAVGEELVSLERFSVGLARAVQSGHRPLFVAADGLTAWVWLALNGNAAAQSVDRARVFANEHGDAPRVAVGTPILGPLGFRESHNQAIKVRAAVLSAQAKLPGFTSAADPGVEIAVRFHDDLDATRRWVAAVLGELASDSDSDERLRETLRVFLRTGSSFKATADEKHLHVNSVKYRVQRAVERRGREISDDRLDVETALALAHWFGHVVLA